MTPIPDRPVNSKFARIIKIISGGQTGADMGGLLAAYELGIQTDGYAPKGYKTEDGPNLDLRKTFGLRETSSVAYIVRTELNVKNSTATVIFGIDSIGSHQTLKICKQHNKPVLWLQPDTKKDSPLFLEWIARIGTGIMLNVAGNRASVNEGIEQRVKEFLIHCARMR